MGKRNDGEGSIRERQNGLFEARLRLPDGAQRSFYGKTRSEVVKKLRDAQRAVEQGHAPAPARLTLGEFLQDYFVTAPPPGLAPKSLLHYRMAVKLYIVPALGKLKLGDVTRPRVQAMLNGLSERGLSAATVIHTRATLSVALEKALGDGLVTYNAAKRAETPSLRRRKVKALTPEDARCIMDAFSGHWLEPLVTVALGTGARQAELLGLGWEDVNLDACTVTIEKQLQRIDGAYRLTPTKSETSNRTLPLPPVAVDALRRERVRQAEARLAAGDAWQGFGHVFVTALGGYLNGSTVTHVFQKRLATAGLDRIRWHDLRHGCASLLLAAGTPMRVVMEQLGHSQMALTANTYSHVAPALMQEAAERLQRALGGA